MATLADVLGHDPWEFQLRSPMRDLSYVIFGWTYYEAAECLSILVGARERWRSPVYIGTAIAVVSEVLATTTILLHASATLDPTDDYFIGPTKFGIDITANISQLVGRWAYFYAAVRMSLAVFPSNRLVKVALCLTALAGVLGNLVYTTTWMRFMRLGYDQYVIYNETKDPRAVISRMNSVIIPYVDKFYAKTALLENLTWFIFIVLTNALFLSKIYRSLNVGFRKATWSILTTRSSQRLVLCVILVIIEATLAFETTRDIKRTVSNYSRAFQITSLAFMAFEGAAAIIKRHSRGSRVSGHYKSKSHSVPTSGTTPKDRSDGAF